MSNLFAGDRTEESQPFDPMEATAPGPDAPHEPDAPVRAGRRRRRRHTLITESAELALGPFAPDGTTPAEYNGRTIPVEKGIAGERADATVLTLTGRNGWTRGSVHEVL